MGTKYREHELAQKPRDKILNETLRHKAVSYTNKVKSEQSDESKIPMKSNL